MTIITRRGDDGLTDVMYGGRTPKTDPAILACGAVDELNSCLGMVRVSGVTDAIVANIDTIQGQLVTLMGLLSVPADKKAKYLEDGYPNITQVEVEWLDAIGEGIEVKMDGWARPGSSGSVSAAWMDMARSICRRAELSVWALREDAPVELCKYLNRLSDILWLWARKLEENA